MKKNSFKVLGSQSPVESSTQASLEQRTNDKVFLQSWLKSAVDEDTTTMNRQEIMQQAEYFLLTDLYPLADQSETIDEELIIELLFRHTKTALAKGAVLEITNVLGAILNRLDCYTADNLESSQGPSELLNKDLILMETLCSLNLQKIDRLVSENLHRS